MFDERVITFNQALNVPGATSPAKDAQARVREKKDKHAWWMESCKTKCTLVQSTTGKRKEIFDWNRYYPECLADEPR